MSQSVLHLAFPISSRQSDDSSPQFTEEPSDEDSLNYQEKGQIFCLGVCQVKSYVYIFFKVFWVILIHSEIEMEKIVQNDAVVCE